MGKGMDWRMKGRARRTEARRGPSRVPLRHPRKTRRARVLVAPAASGVDKLLISESRGKPDRTLIACRWTQRPRAHIENQCFRKPSTCVKLATESSAWSDGLNSKQILKNRIS